jgi:hypothetical protein
MVEISVKGGVIKYRLPNFAESWRLRAAVGEMPKGYNAHAWGYAKIAENLCEFIDASGVKQEDGEPPILENPDYAQALTEIISNIVLRAVEFYPEKKQISKK